MSLTADQIASEALSLPRPERARVADVLIASLATEPEVEHAWDTEIRRRLRDIDAGVTQMIPGDEVLAEVEALLRQ
jgi:putative addiction module component (TIGR02574 family)